MNEIISHFPEFSDIQVSRLKKLMDLYIEWNEKINIISRKDIQNLEINHILHSLSIYKTFKFSRDTHILDVGTGGGLPGLPLAIALPYCNFHLIDAVNKKIKVVKDIINRLDLDNVTSEHIRSEDLNYQYDVIVSRAVSAMPKFIAMVKKCIKPAHNKTSPHGIIYLKGDDIVSELQQLNIHYYMVPIKSFLPYNYFNKKYVVHIPEMTR